MENTAIEQQAARDAEINAAASALDSDFDPELSGIEDADPQSEKAQLQALMTDDEGAQYAATEAVNTFEMLLQQFGHPAFAIEPTKKEQTAKTLAPVVKKHGASIGGAFGDWKEEIFAALSVGSLVFGSIKEIKELKQMDAAKQVTPEQAESEAETTDKAEASEAEKG